MISFGWPRQDIRPNRPRRFGLIQNRKELQTKIDMLRRNDAEPEVVWSQSGGRKRKSRGGKDL